MKFGIDEGSVVPEGFTEIKITAPIISTRTNADLPTVMEQYGDKVVVYNNGNRDVADQKVTTDNTTRSRVMVNTLLQSAYEKKDQTKIKMETITYKLPVNPHSQKQLIGSSKEWQRSAYNEHAPQGEQQLEITGHVCWAVDKRTMGTHNVCLSCIYKVWEIAVLMTGSTFVTGHTPVVADAAEGVDNDAFAASLCGTGA